MYAIDNATAATSMPAVSAAGVPGFFTGGNPGAGLAATVVTADWLNIVQQELLGVLAEAGIAPSKNQLNQIALGAQKLGLVRPFSADFAMAVGGYPLNAIVADAATVGLLWISTAGSNTTTPNTDGAAWQIFGWNQFIKQGLSDGALATGNQVYIGLREGVTSGAARIGAKVDETDFGNFAMTGNKTLGLGDWTEQYYTLASGGSKTISLEFDAPLDGYVLVIGSANYSVQNTNQTNLTISVNGTNLSADQVTGSTSMTNHSCVKVSAGPVTVGSYCGTSATNPPNVGHTLSYLYIPA